MSGSTLRNRTTASPTIISPRSIAQRNCKSFSYSSNERFVAIAMIFAAASAMCHRRDSRSASSSGVIQRALAELENLEEIRIANGFTYDEIDAASEELLDRNH